MGLEFATGTATFFHMVPVSITVYEKLTILP